MLFSADNQPQSRFFERIPEARQCVRMNRLGRRCGKAALKGCEACGSHGGWAERRKRYGTPYPARIMALREIKRLTARVARKRGVDWLWQDERFRRASGMAKAGIVAAAILA